MAKKNHLAQEIREGFPKEVMFVANNSKIDEEGEITEIRGKLRKDGDWETK